MKKINIDQLNNMIIGMVETNSSNPERCRFGAIIENDNDENLNISFLSYESILWFAKVTQNVIDNDTIVLVDLYTGELVSMKTAYEISMERIGGKG